MELGLFDQVGDAVRTSVPPELGEVRLAVRRWGIKVWFDEPECPREHFEAQVLSADHVAEAEVLAIEVGFHAEHPNDADNDDAMVPILGAESTWRTALGDGVVAGAFLGRSGWQRISETWPDPDLSDPELCFELADRLVAYLEVIEPLRRATR